MYRVPLREPPCYRSAVRSAHRKEVRAPALLPHKARIPPYRIPTMDQIV